MVFPLHGDDGLCYTWDTHLWVHMLPTVSDHGVILANMTRALMQPVVNVQYSDLPK